MKMVLIRHGETEWSKTARHTGRTDIPLDENGKNQADAARVALRTLLGDELRQAHVFSSPLRRARDTAAAVSESTSEVLLSDNLLEFDYGDYEGLTPTEVRDMRPGWDIWRDGCPNGETAEKVGTRVDNFIAEIPESNSVNLVFAHGHVIRILAARAVGLEAGEGRIFTLDTATISVIEDVRGIRVVKLWNLDPFLVHD